MKVYIVTSGCYSDYAIEAVFDSEDKASVFQALHCPQDGRVEVFDTEEIQIEASVPIYQQWFGVVGIGGKIGVRKKDSFSDCPRFEVSVDSLPIPNARRYYVHFTTKKDADEETARKILADKLTEWKYEQEA